MDKRLAHNFFVGIFVVVAVSVFLFIVFNIGGGNGFLSRHIALKGTFHHVKGLNFGSEVSLSGLRIGTVKSITVGDASKRELIVEMSINRNMTDKVRRDSVASIKTSGVLGDKYIEISIGNPEMPELKDGEFIPTEEPEDLFSKSGNLLENISHEFQKGGDLKAVLSNLNQLSQNLVYLSNEIKTQQGLFHELIYGQSGKNINKATGHLEEILRKINSGQGTLGALINDPTVYEDVKAMMGGAKRSSILKYFMQKFVQDGAEADKKK